MSSGPRVARRVRAVALGLAFALSSSAAAAPDDASAALARAKAVMGFGRTGATILHYRASAASDDDYESDRSYPPYFARMQAEEVWFDPATGVQRVTTRTMYPSGEAPASVVMTDARRAFNATQEPARPLALSALQDARYLDPWPVIADWARARDVRVAGREVYRDYPRVVLVRGTPEGDQRLFVDPKTGFPVKVELVVRHYLWGQQRVEYVYSNWIQIGGAMLAAASFRLVDGQPQTRRTIGPADLVARSTVALPALPALPAESTNELPAFLQPRDLTTIAVSPSTYLLSNVGYTEAVTRVGDEVFVLDATQGESRVDKVEQAIARLFPGTHKRTVVVTDLAWPHIAGVRAWVARGATIVTHRAASEFLRKVIDRRWTLAPDLLERRRGSVTTQIVEVDGTTPLAGGAITLHPIDGIASEVAIMAYVAADQFLWASDYLQPPSGFASVYVVEVVNAVRRDRLTPARTAAQHLPLTPWSAIEARARP